jgi:choice-of-anchor C domain-containing protein
MGTKMTLAAKLMGVIIALPLAASANLVVDGTFPPPPDGSPTFTDIGVGATIGPSAAWRVTAGTVDVINGYWQAPPQGGQSLDMEGISEGTIQQSISGLVAGQQYLLTFEMSGNPDGPPTTKTLAVSLGGGVTQDFSYTVTGNRTDMDWMLKTGLFTAGSSSTVLQFADISGDPGFYGAVLGDVSLVPVPEPATMIAGALLLLPFGASTLRILRKARTE